MARQYVRQKVIKSSDIYDDTKTPAEIANAEITATNNEEFQAYILAQIKQVLGTTNWHDGVPISLSAVTAGLLYTSSIATTSLAAINTLAAATSKTIVINTPVILDSTTTVTQPVVIISPVGRITQTGAYVVTFSSTFSSPLINQLFYGFSRGQILGIKDVDVTWFGDCTVDIGNVLSIAIANMKAIGGRIRLPNSVNLRAITSVDATFVRLPIEFYGYGRGITIIQGILTGPVFDCVGSSFFTFKDFTVSGNSVTIPTTAFLLARDSSNDSASDHHFFNISTMGYFSAAPIYEYGSECLRFWGCEFDNSYPDGKSAVFTRNNVFGLTSSYRAIATGPQSNTEFKLYGTILNNWGTGNADALYIEGVSDFLYSGGFMSLNGRSAVCFDGSFGLESINYNVTITTLRTEHSGIAVPPTYIIYAKDNSLNYYPIFENISGGTKSYADGGRAIRGDDGSRFMFGNIHNLNISSTGDPLPSIDIDTLQFSNVNCEAFKLYVRYDCPSNFIRVSSANLFLTRPDFAKTTIFEYTNQGVFSPDVLLCNCSAAETVGCCVYTSGPEVTGRYAVSLADPTNFNKMPAIGIVHDKPTTTTANVRFSGPVSDVYSGLATGKVYFVDTDGTPTDIPPVGALWVQKIGLATSATTLLLFPSVDMVRGGI